MLLQDYWRITPKNCDETSGAAQHLWRWELESDNEYRVWFFHFQKMDIYQ